ncbi:hypothetical protein MD484_g4503, partial [Candolleomyces efflorescens]
MSLTSFLISKSSQVVDSELDDLFKSAPRARPTTGTGPRPTNENGKQKKRKRKAITEDEGEGGRGAGEAGPSTSTTLSSKRLKSDVRAATTAATTTSSSSSSAKLKTKTESKSKAAEPRSTEPTEKAPPPPSSTDSEEDEDEEEEDEDEEENSDIENRYLAQRAKRDKVGKGGAGKEGAVDSESDSEDAEEVDDDDDEEEEGEEGADNDDDDEEEEGGEPPVHESLLKNNQSKNSTKNGKKKKYVPEDETPEMRDRRTIFVGNLPIAIAQKRPLKKQLQRHILSFVPTAKIESTRFRSVPFQNPTSKLPDDGADTENSASTKKPSTTPRSSEKPTNHSTTRAQTWRRTGEESKEDEETQPAKKDYLTPNQKKKIAFINHQFHSTADSVNCYVVFAHPVPPLHLPRNGTDTKNNETKDVQTMDPYEAAKQAVERGNNSVFMERVVRVDRVGKHKRALGEQGGGGGGAGGGDEAQGDADPKFTVFVGNLDFASKEEDVRVFFESLVEKEKGPALALAKGEEGMDVDEEKEKKRKGWVVRVRIVRDRETQLGKGFAYVQFSDKECVDEILALEEPKLKFAKRKLRVERCKTIPGTSFKIKSTPSARPSSSSSSSTTSSSSKKPTRATSTPPTIIPKGDPTLGERLAHLPKAVRKDVKRNDGDRVARRLAKKKARMAMGPPKSTAATNAGSNDGTGRERKRALAGQKEGKKGGGNVGKGKRRVRSEKMVAKRNGKK